MSVVELGGGRGNGNPWLGVGFWGFDTRGQVSVSNMPKLGRPYAIFCCRIKVVPYFYDRQRLLPARTAIGNVRDSSVTLRPLGGVERFELFHAKRSDRV